MCELPPNQKPQNKGMAETMICKPDIFAATYEAAPAPNDKDERRP